MISDFGLPQEELGVLLQVISIWKSQACLELYLCFLITVYFLCTVYQLPQPTWTQKAIVCNTMIIPVCHTLTIGAIPRAATKHERQQSVGSGAGVKTSENQLRPIQVLSLFTVWSAQSLWSSTNNGKNLTFWAAVTVFVKLVKVQHLVMIRKPHNFGTTLFIPFSLPCFSGMFLC